MDTGMKQKADVAGELENGRQKKAPVNDGNRRIFSYP